MDLSLRILMDILKFRCATRSTFTFDFRSNLDSEYIRNASTKMCLPDAPFALIYPSVLTALRPVGEALRSP